MRWYLTQKVVGEPEIDVRDDEDLTFGYSIMRELARRDATLVEIAPGVWWQSKTDNVREN
ncbi:hypothetical protein ACIBSW_27585 [Actinoplanes sp. NPDC049668]|uniref:hypothetical protein n=1 Tax=unclassified Actinoplanes TaxID=2626549 RepID=UPI0033ABA1A9